MRTETFIKTNNIDIVKKLFSKGVVPCCLGDNEERYFINRAGTLALLSDEEKRQLIYTNVLMG